LKLWPSRRRAVVSIGFAAILIAGFWIFVFPQTRLYKRYVVKTQLSWLLKDIAPPANTITMGIQAQSGINVSEGNDLSMGMGQYLTGQDFNAVKQHYLVEFPRHKFVYKHEDRKDNGDVDITFCRTGYQATLSLTNGPKIQDMRIYTILLVKSAGIRC
jgi:hypothetical protein